MSTRTWMGKQSLLFLSILIAVISCKKQSPEEEATAPPPVSTFEASFEPAILNFCGSPYTTDLRIQDGSTIGSVTVGNDATHLYLTYHLEEGWYLTGAQSYAGDKASIPASNNGALHHEQFPAKQSVSPCDLKQTLTFKVLLSVLDMESTDQCTASYFVAMRASVKYLPNTATCSMGEEEEAWAAPVLINPGNQTDWSTAFYYCRQECPPPPAPWCAFGQGYWFASGKHPWCDGQVAFGDLIVKEAEGVAIWGQRNRTTLQKAFFQASALQLSMKCNNEGRAIPESIRKDYEFIKAVLEKLTLKDVEHGKLPDDVKEIDLQYALGNIGKWICANNCDPQKDPTACSN